jgi:hypothetical protein
MGLKQLHSTFLNVDKRPFVAPFQDKLVWVAEVDGKLKHGFGLRSLPSGQEFVRLDAEMKHGATLRDSLSNIPAYGQYRN